VKALVRRVREYPMAKVETKTYRLLEPGRYVLEILSAELVDDYGKQLKLELRVAAGEEEGYVFFDYPNRDRSRRSERKKTPRHYTVCANQGKGSVDVRAAGCYLCAAVRMRFGALRSRAPATSTAPALCPNP
jgi:hypothetical protein